MHSLVLAAALLLWGCASNAQVAEGDKVPAFRLKDQHGQVFDLASVLGKQPLVIYFYPKDETSICTKEACSFRDAYAQFQEHGARVIGISSDGVESHRQFAEHHQLPFTLLADTAKAVRALFGVPKTFMLPGRVTYVVDKQGVVVHRFNSMRDAEKHVTEALVGLEKMK
ncbi:peroxiredoxin [Chitinophaga japonensis]